MSAKKTGKILSSSISIDNPKKIKIACVISEWHNEITENFYNGALDKLSQYGGLDNNIDNAILSRGERVLF
jgi:6,7-dimethyl-8-ribityllumazine synthase